MVKARAAAAGRRLSARVVGCWWRQRPQRNLRSFILGLWLVGDFGGARGWSCLTP